MQHISLSLAGRLVGSFGTFSRSAVSTWRSHAHMHRLVNLVQVQTFFGIIL